ncbi:MAG: LamG domain-containing protein, partial [Candidatus Poribacteria bacterium]|nr:LamG domain-containing protein [Candidatus Poribacteria bacterium]
MIAQGKSLESYAESIGVELPKVDASASILYVSSMISQGKSLESYAESIGVELPNVSNQDSSKFFLVNSIEEFSSNLVEIKPPTLDSTEIALVVTFPFAIYVVLIAEGVVRPPKPAKIPQSASFYFIFVFYVFSTFSTPFAIGQSYWGVAYGEMDNTTTTTDSTEIVNPNVSITEITQAVESAVSSIDNATLTQTDNVADPSGLKHYLVSITEGLNVSDGPSDETQNLNEPIVMQEPVSSANSTNIQILESVSFFDHITVESFIISDETINLNEQIAFSDGADGLSGIITVKISEHITFGADLETVLYTPLRKTVEIQEDLSIGAQIVINDVVEILVSEFIEFSETITIKAPVIIILESIKFSESFQSQLVVAPLEDISYIELLSQDSALILDGTTGVAADQNIPNTTNALTISAWINPEFNTGSPQYTIVSKEYSFDLYLANILEPARTAGFSVFDGAQWKTVTGSTVLDERWHHVVASVNGSNITLYVDGLLEGELKLEDDIIIQESQITSDDSEIVIGAYVNTVNVPMTFNKFAGMITSVGAYTHVLTAEQVYQKYQIGVQEFYKSVSLYETVSVDEYVYNENPSHIQLEEHIAFYDETIVSHLYHIQLEEHL